jgi:DNA-binding FadR family transcriptional regulator
MSAVPSAFERALDQLGAAIVAGELPAGHTDTVEGFVARTGASRSVVREVTRVLGALGMLSAGRRIGLRIRPLDEWDLLDPRVIRWRLEGSDAAVQLAELRSLRHAIEPAAAAAAARAVGEGRGSTEELDRALAAMDSAAAGPE